MADGLLRSIRAEANGRPAVAVTWSSDESHLVFASKSLTLDQIEPLLAMGDIHWVVCQRGLQRQAWLETDLAATSTVLRSAATPARWPNARGSPRCLAQRPLPSMMIATCSGEPAS